MSKYSKSTGSMTEWIATCRCDIVTPASEDQTKTVNLCTTCGKRINQGRVGSFTQFIFRFDLCSCAKPSWLPAAAAPNDILDSAAGLLPDYDDDIENEIEIDQSLAFDSDSFPVDRYKPLKVLGSGAGGVVYLCRDLLLKKLVALKTLHALVGEQLVAFQNEARLLSKLDHPNIVRILDFGVTKGGAPYMVLENSSGTNLAAAIQANETLSASSVKQIFVALADALIYCHERGIFHRDLKPENILFTKVVGKSTTVQLIDFGIATVGSQQKTHFDGRELVGTPLYMPPDQMLGLTYDCRSEIYSLGCVMFEALTGRPVFSGDSVFEILTKHATEPPPIAALADFAVPEYIQDIVKICLSKEREDRYQTMQELKTALSATPDYSDLAATLPLSGLVEGEEQSAPADVQKQLNATANNRVKIAILSCALLGGSALAVSAFMTKTEEPIKKPTIETKKKDRVKREKTYRIIPTGSFIQISGDDITREAFVELAKICQPGSSERSYSVLFENEPQKVDWSALDELKYSQIHSIMVQRTSFSDNECETIAQFPHLAKIDARWTKVTNVGIEKLTHSKSLVQFLLSGNNATCDCLQYFKNAPNTTCLEIDGFPLVKLSNLDVIPRLNILVQLNIGHVNLGDQGLRILCKSKHLNDLNLSNCGITDSGTQFLEGTPIEVLTLSDAAITDKSIAHLIKMPKLNRLVLGRDTEISAAAEKRLQAAKPAVKVRRGVIVRAKIEDALKESMPDIQSFDSEFFSSTGEQLSDPNGGF